MSTQYKTNKKILMKDLLDGRLQEFGINHTYQTDRILGECRLLIHGEDQVRAYGDTHVEYLERCGHNHDYHILCAISTIFQTEICSEYSPQFWGYDTERDWLTAELPHSTQKSDTYSREQSARGFVLIKKGRNGWCEFKKKEIINHTGCNTLSAEYSIQCALDEHLLLDSFTVYFRHFGLVSISELLCEPQKFDNQLLADPLEADYSDYCQKFEWNDGDPQIRPPIGDLRIYKFHESQVNKAILMHGISNVYLEEGREFAPRALKAAVDLLLGGYK